MRKILAFMLMAALLCGVFSPAACAYDSDSPVEFLPDWTIPAEPQWTEQEVTCQSGENTLRGTLTIPKDAEGQVPMAVLFHGLNTDRRWCDGIAWILADNGIASLRFDYAGNGVSDGQQWEMTVSTLIRDTRAIIQYARSLEITDQDNVFAVGKSMGAVNSIMASMSEDLKAICMWYPAFCLRDGTEQGFFLWHNFYADFPPPFMTIAGFTYGSQFLKELQVLDYEAACESYDGSVMIIHGTNDLIVPLFSSFDVEPLFQDCTLRVMPGGGHGFFGPMETIALNEMVTFLKNQID